MRADAKKNYAHILTVARDLVAVKGADASLRDIARTAGVGLGTLYRHFPTREALLEAMLRERFDDLTRKATALETSDRAGEALVSWLRETVAVAHNYSGAIASMVAAIEDEESALHASCVAMKAAGTRLLTRAQSQNVARADMDGIDLFALVSALAWVSDQPVLTGRSDRIFDIITSSITIRPAKPEVRTG